MIKKIFLFAFILWSNQIFCQSVTSINKETIATAKHQAVITLKKTLDQPIILDGIDNVLKNGQISADVYLNYFRELEKSYLQKTQSSKDSKSYQDNFFERSLTNRFYSKSKSLECLNKTVNTDFVRTKDSEGEEIVAFPLESLRSNTRYGLVDNYHHGFARIKKDQVFGFINQCGEEIIPAQYELAETFNGGKALVKKFVWYFVDAEGNEGAELEGIQEAKALNYGVSLVKFKNNKFALINNDFETTKKPISQFYDQIEPFNLGNNLYKVRIGKQYGLIRINGVQVLDINYDNISASELEQYILVEKANKVGLVSIDGSIKLKTDFENISGVIINQVISKSALPIIVKDPNGFKVIDLSNDKSSKFYTSINSFNAFGLAKSCKDEGGKIKCGYLNYEGKEVIPVQFDVLFDFTRFGLVVARNKYENCLNPTGPCQADIVYDKTGKIIKDLSSTVNPISIKYTITDTLFNKTLIAIKTAYANESKTINEGFHLIDKTNNNFITTIPYAQIKRFNDEYIAVMNDEKWGVLDLNGKIIIKTIYNQIVNESEGMFGVKLDNNYGFVDRRGKVQITFDFSEIQAFKNGLAIVAKNKKYGIITKFNAKIAPCVFKEINPIPGGNFELVDASNIKYILNSNGDCQTNCAKFDEIRKKANN